jgi:hypothetical protein
MAYALLYSMPKAMPEPERLKAEAVKVWNRRDKMNRFKKLAALFAFALLVFGLPTLASAQYRDNDRNDDDYYRTDRNRRNRNDDDDYNRNGRYNNRGNLQGTVKSLKNRSREFARRLDRELDRSRYDNSRREDQLNRLADDFRRATENLDDEYDNRRDYNRSSDEVRRVLQLGQQLDNAVYRSRLNNNLQGDWNRIQQDLDVLANAYGYNNRNNRNNRNNGSWRDRVPFPLPY